MDVIVRGRQLEISDRFREHVTGKLSRADRFGLAVDTIDVAVTQEPNPRQADRAFKVEITCRGTGPVVRAEAYAQDKHAALDAAHARLEEQLRRAADKRRTHRNSRVVLQPLSDLPLDLTRVGEPGSNGDNAGDAEADGAPDDGTVWEEGPLVVRLKEHVTEPMSVGQAVDSMELVGHDFYLFREIESGNPAVVYRRRGYTYGLIRLDSGAAE